MLPVNKQGVIITEGGMEDSLVVILRLGGAGTHSKHFPEERKSTQKRVRVSLPLRKTIHSTYLKQRIKDTNTKCRDSLVS